MQYIIIGNFGNHSLAVMQALIEKKLPELHFVYVDTGWAASSWSERVYVCSQYASTQGVRVHPLKARAGFADMVQDRKQFPSEKFQWCASFLKGLTLVNFLDEFDSQCEAMIVSGKRQQDSRRYANLQEFENEGDIYQGRTIWHPLWQTNDHEFVELIKRTGLPVLYQPSLECSPCIHAKDLSYLDAECIARLEALENAIGQCMYKMPIRALSQVLNNAQASNKLDLQQYDLGCGSPWCCGE